MKTDDFEELYDEIIDLCVKVQLYADMHIFNEDNEEEKERYRKLRDAVGNLHDTARDLEKHLAGD